MKPNFLVIGAQKSASTFVQLCLAEHPEVYLPAEEIPFFESPDYEGSSFSDLESLFEGKTQKALGIKRPSYLGKAEVALRIQNCLPDAKLIAILRNPLERAISAYFHYIDFRFLPNVPVENGMKAILDGTYTKLHLRSPEILEFGFYHKHLKEYQFFHERNQMYILLHEDILKDKAASIRKIYEFLGVNPDFRPNALQLNPQAVTYNHPRLVVSRLKIWLMFDYNQEVTQLYLKKNNPTLVFLGECITFFDKTILSALFGNRRPKVSSDLYARLIEFYADDIDRLETLIGRELKTWKAPQHVVRNLG